MLEDNLKTQLKGYLERLVQPVEKSCLSRPWYRSLRPATRPR
jgi:hypothetical protein